jgi:hypothetical protein
MSKDKEQIRIVLEQAQRLEKTLPDWIYRVEQINRQQYERSRSLASFELEKTQKSEIIKKSKND